MILVHAALIPVVLAIAAVLGLRIVATRLARVPVLTLALTRRRFRLAVPGGGGADAGDEEDAERQHDERRPDQSAACPGFPHNLGIGAAGRARPRP